MKILGIETSCDETALAVIQTMDDEIEIIGNFLFSQSEIHSKYGGVVPEIAARNHTEKIFPLLRKIQKKIDLNELDIIAVTYGPGLITSLMVGVEFAKTLSYALKKPLLPLNHLEGHIAVSLAPEEFSNKKEGEKMLLKKLRYPLLVLIVSGGHTELIFSNSIGHYKLIGHTLDDAAGEAFDKVAKLMGLSYPGGPIISLLAQEGDENKYPLPRPLLRQNNLHFSFSGLKTAVRYLLLKLPSYQQADIAASFQKAVIEVLVEKTKRAVQQFKVETVIVGGGVAANTVLRTELSLALRHLEPSPTLLLPPTAITTDNGLMMTLAAVLLSEDKKIFKKRIKKTSWKNLQANPNLQLEDVSI